MYRKPYGIEYVFGTEATIVIHENIFSFIDNIQLVSPSMKIYIEYRSIIHLSQRE
jgi:hypothetical protein